MLKNLFVQEFSKDISHKKADFRHLEGKSAQITKTTLVKRKGKENKEKTAKRSVKKGDFFRALKNVFLWVFL